MYNKKGKKMKHKEKNAKAAKKKTNPHSFEKLQTQIIL